jgi:putative tributyrin esterase
MPRFRTLEISDPRFENEGLRWITVKSPALRQRADITVFVPTNSKSDQDLPVAILLHGVYGSHWAWALKGGAHRTAARMIQAGEIVPMVLAMPSDGLWGDGSGYVPHETQDFDRWIVEDVPTAVCEAVPGVGQNSPFCISGLSMGGFGAMRLGAKYPQIFKAVGGHSSMTHFDQHTQFTEEPLESYGCPTADRSVLETMMRNRDRLPPVRFDCGTEDPLLAPNRKLSQELKRAGIAHTYEEFPGGHEWPYWETHLADMLRFFSQTLHSR